MAIELATLSTGSCFANAQVVHRPQVPVFVYTCPCETVGIRMALSCTNISDILAGFMCANGVLLLECGTAGMFADPSANKERRRVYPFARLRAI